MSDVETLADLAVRLRMSLSWTQKHWRELDGLPRPFIGGDRNQRPRWRRADLDRYFAGDVADAPAPPKPAARPAPPANAPDPMLSSLLRAAGG